MGVLRELFSAAVVSGTRRGDVPLIPDEQGPEGEPLNPDFPQGPDGTPLRYTHYKVVHAPAGGVSVGGKHFTGGQFIPGDVMEKATPTERSKVEGKSEAESPQGPDGKPLKERKFPSPKADATPAVPPIAPGFGPDLNVPVKTTPGLYPNDARIEQESQAYVRANYPAVRELYLRGDPERGLPANGVFDPETGELKSVTINTDEWRARMPGYHGTNAGAVHNASSWANKQLRREMMEVMKGRGNNQMLVMGGGGGSGKGYALSKLVGKDDYPLILDQVTDDLHELENQFADAARPASDGRPGMGRHYVFVDRPPREALGGVVSRAENGAKKRAAGVPGAFPRTVDLNLAARANMAARQTAVEYAAAHPGAASDVWDGRAGRYVPAAEVPEYLRARLAEDAQTLEATVREVEAEVASRAAAGELDRALADGLLGPNWHKRIMLGGPRDPAEQFLPRY